MTLLLLKNICDWHIMASSKIIYAHELYNVLVIILYKFSYSIAIMRAYCVIYFFYGIQA
ncbi:protein of unknown function [Enterobacter cancerogenus]|nr:protein of unknown function [Enterobacter cancerogenus]